MTEVHSGIDVGKRAVGYSDADFVGSLTNQNAKACGRRCGRASSIESYFIDGKRNILCTVGNIECRAAGICNWEVDSFAVAVNGDILTSRKLHGGGQCDVIYKPDLITGIGSPA